jgi:glycosyltransferase involved in cell wall biosynthesis
MPDRRLVVVGNGPEFNCLKAQAGPNIEIVGQQSHDSLHQYLRSARGFVFAAEEDFGIAAVEAQACGTPVIAYGRGGITESVVAGWTGVFFDEQTPQSLVEAVAAFERMKWNPAAIRNHAQRFSASRFRDEFRQLVEQQWSHFKRGVHRQTERTPLMLALPDMLEETPSGGAPGEHEVLPAGATMAGWCRPEGF